MAKATVQAPHIALEAAEAAQLMVLTDQMAMTRADADLVLVDPVPQRLLLRRQASLAAEQAVPEVDAEAVQVAALVTMGPLTMKVLADLVVQALRADRVQTAQ